MSGGEAVAQGRARGAAEAQCVHSALGPLARVGLTGFCREYVGGMEPRDDVVDSEYSRELGQRGMK